MTPRHIELATSVFIQCLLGIIAYMIVAVAGHYLGDYGGIPAMLVVDLIKTCVFRFGTAILVVRNEDGNAVGKSGLGWLVWFVFYVVGISVGIAIPFYLR